MSDFDSNPFADPEFSNPFQDPSVTQVRQAAPPGLEEYNPFTDAKQLPAGMAPKIAAPIMNTQPAIMKPTEEPPAYSQPQDQSRGAAELLKRQEELERKAAELDRRREKCSRSMLQEVSIRLRHATTDQYCRKNNWPPLPEKFPVGPCFYHDITVDIPVDFQKTVKIMYYLWMFHSGTLLANMVGCMAWFCVDASRGVDFGLSILWLLLFTPCSYVCWYRPIYGAFRSDSSFRFFVFFFVYICQFGIYVMQCIGITGWGASGWISALTGLNRSIPVGIIMILIAALFTALAVMSLIMFKKVHAMYRTTGASFERAQQEFATGVMSNKTVRTAAATAATRAAEESFKEGIDRAPLRPTLALIPPPPYLCSSQLPCLIARRTLPPSAF
ncbi:Secretory carrier-associated membrane protein 1 [Larimichthys crocea]|uniref:Secretory carrier-associated membrane protein n=1 Tax=Larimichthys crocea TaxID=215358 RepID=A0A6G0I200_LARCR|nr:Secretory carrier-associated membrane protein 1 [Larimichthys crocea]